ncbi:MAG: glycosyltransferase family 2 protein, partial [Panacagrimonas sp.]
AVSLVKDEADIIGATLLHLLGLGIRRFVIGDNGSTDTTPDIIRRFAADHPEATVVFLHDPVPALEQWRKVTAMVHFAHHYFGVDFIYPFDADEFLVPPSALVSEPGSLDADAIANLLPSGDWDYLSLPWFTCIADDADGALWMSREASHQSKILVRWREDLVIAQGMHCATSVRRRWWTRSPRTLQGTPSRWRVLHVPVRSASQLRAKIIRSAIANRDNPANWGKQSRSLYAAFQRHGDAVFTTLHDLVSDPQASAADLDRFARRFGLDARTLCYFRDYFRPRIRVPFRLPSSPTSCASGTVAPIVARPAVSRG